MRYTTFTDQFIGTGINIEFTYTRLEHNRWHVVVYLVSGHTQTEIYTAVDEGSESLEELFATHRVAVSYTLASLASLVAIKEQKQ
jgi:hypothetical protein